MIIQNSISRQGNNVFLRIGRDTYTYNIKSRPLGCGAMGAVFLGRDVSKHHSVVAIKMVKPQYTHIPAVRNRARIEASYCFNHPNLIEMLGCCEDGTKDGPLFIVSKYINGETLDKYVRNNMAFAKDRTRQICQLVYPILEALGYLHSKGIIHLDVKPSNIMVENGHNIKLMDLGIAQIGGTTGSLKAGLYGTAGYAAPEQYGNNKNGNITISPATDIYAVGVTLHELLYGSLPIGNACNSSSHKKNKVDSAVMDVIQKAIAPMPQNRYQSASEMASALTFALKKNTKQTNVSKYLVFAVISLLFALLILILLIQ